MKERPKSAIPDPTYPWQFRPYFSELLEQKEQFRINILGRMKKHEEEREGLAIHVAGLNEILTNGETVEGYHFNNADKSLERLNVEKSGLLMRRDTVLNKISILARRVFAFFLDMDADFDAGYISKEEFISYLVKYKNLLEDTLGLVALQRAPVEAIWKRIHEFCPENTNNN